MLGNDEVLHFHNTLKGVQMAKKTYLSSVTNQPSVERTCFNSAEVMEGFCMCRIGTIKFASRCGLHQKGADSLGWGWLDFVTILSDVVV